MIDWDNKVRSEDQELGALTSDLWVRVLNGSATGCLVESPRALQVGTVAGLRVNFRGHDYDDPVKVTRCQSIAGAGDVPHRNGVSLDGAAVRRNAPVCHSSRARAVRRLDPRSRESGRLAHDLLEVDGSALSNGHARSDQPPRRRTKPRWRLGLLPAARRAGWSRRAGRCSRSHAPEGRSARRRRAETVAVTGRASPRARRRRAELRISWPGAASAARRSARAP